MLPGGQDLAIGGPDATFIWDIDNSLERAVDESVKSTAMDVHSTIPLVVIATPGVSDNNFNSGNGKFSDLAED